MAAGVGQNECFSFKEMKEERLSWVVCDELNITAMRRRRSFSVITLLS